MTELSLHAELLRMLELDRMLDDWAIPQPERLPTPPDHRMPSEGRSSLNTATIHGGTS